MENNLYILIYSTWAGRIDPAIRNWAQQAALDELYRRTQAMKPMRVPS